MATITKYLRYGEETDFGQETSDYAETVDPTTASLDPAGDDKLILEGIGGLDRVAGLGVYSTAGDIGIPLDDQATGWFWKWALGGYEASGDAGAYTHTFTPQLGGLMTPFSCAVGKDQFEHVFTGNVISEISLEADAEWAALSVSVMGSKDLRATLVEEVDYTEGHMFTAPEGRLVSGQSDRSADVNSVSLSISTGADVTTSAGFGSRFPTKATRGSMEVSMELSLAFDSMDELERFWGETQGPSTDNIEEESYTLSFGDSIDIVIPRTVATSVGQPADGRGTISQSVTLRGLYSETTRSGPVEVHLTNDRESYSI